MKARGPSAGVRDNDPTATRYRAVPWLMRGIEMRANALASVPFQIVRGETPVDTSDEYKDALGILPDPYRMLWLLEAALCFGPAYLWREKNSVKTKALKYVAASTITPKIDPALGLTGFKRQLSTGAPIEAKPEDVLYFWKPDPFVELGPPQVTPVGAALAAAGVLFNLDQFAASILEKRRDQGNAAYS